MFINNLYQIKPWNIFSHSTTNLIMCPENIWVVFSLKIKKNRYHFLYHITLCYLETMGCLLIFDKSISMKMPVAAFLVSIQLCWAQLCCRLYNCAFFMFKHNNSSKELVANLWVCLRAVWSAETCFKSFRVWKLSSVIALFEK